MSTHPRVAVSVVSWNHGKFLGQLIASLKSVSWPASAWKIFLVDNASTDGTNELVPNSLIDESRGTIFGTDIPAVFLPQTTNLGFTGGNNLVFRKAVAEGFDYVYLLNPDTEVTAHFIGEAVPVAERDQSIGIVQSLLLLARERSRINSWGNEIHYLGFSFCGGYEILLADPRASEHLKVQDIPSASGAAMLIRVSAMGEVGFFDENILAYHDDVDLCMRMRLHGFRIVLAPDSRVYHHYEFSRSIKKFYFMERNRWWVHGKLLHFPTLLLLLPAWVAMELGLWFFALRSGWWREKWRSYQYFFSVKRLRELRRLRSEAQAGRTVSDRSLVQFFSSSLDYQEVRNPLWDRFGNPIFSWYWRLVRRVIWW